MLNRPKARNSLSEAMLEALSATFAEVATNKRVRAVVLAATARRSAPGMTSRKSPNAAAIPTTGVLMSEDFMDRCSAMMQSIHRMPQPVIAAVEGAATAAGCQLVGSCDLAVASQTAKFATPGVHIGLFCSTPMVALSRNVAPKHAMEMLLTGDLLTADDAHRIGLVNRVVARRYGDATRHLSWHVRSPRNQP